MHELGAAANLRDQRVSTAMWERTIVRMAICLAITVIAGSLYMYWSRRVAEEKNLVVLFTAISMSDARGVERALRH